MEGVRQGFAVFDAKKTKIACSRAFHFLKTYQNPLHEIQNGKKKKLDILFVNTSEHYRHLIQKVARITHQRYIHEKWVGGTLTNWSQISQSYSLFGRFHLLFGSFLKKRKIHLPVYEKARRIYSGLLPRKTRKKKIHLNSQFLSIEDMGESQTVFSDGLPDIVFLINPEENQNVLHEANLLKIPVIALADSQTKIQGIDYTIPGNVQSIKFVYWFLNCMTIILQKRNKRKKKKSITSSTLQKSTTE
jgi:small subunit ribosomal protein S2